MKKRVKQRRNKKIKEQEIKNIILES